MSLLTEEQLKEILLIIEEEVNVEWPCVMLEMLHEWNEKQPPQTAREMYQRGYAAAERDLKREPLSDATIADLWGEEHSGKTNMIKNFARVIEKMHGIGTVE
jgi:hypothetical protein